jgi:hypothetical protein
LVDLLRILQATRGLKQTAEVGCIPVSAPSTIG